MNTCMKVFFISIALKAVCDMEGLPTFGILLCFTDFLLYFFKVAGEGVGGGSEAEGGGCLI